jgi:hypothetical protein
MKTTHPWIQIQIDNFEVGVIESKAELEEKIFEVIWQLTTPRESPGGKYKQPELY